MTTLCNEVQLRNVFLPGDETESGISIPSMDVQFSNALLSIRVSESGRDTVLRAAMSLNAELPTEVTPYSMTRSVTMSE